MPSTTSKTKRKHSWVLDAIGTSWSIETVLPLGNEKREIEERIESFDRTYSRFRDDSLIAKIAKDAGIYEFPQDADKLFHAYRKLYDATDGAVSPLVGRTLSDAGYDKEYSLRTGTVEPAPIWDDVMEWDGARLKTTRPLLLDFGAAGKGYLVDMIGELLEHHDHDDYVIDASGDIRVRGGTESIGLENPYDATSVIGSVPLKNASLCASATNRRTWGEWHHVIDPRTAKPVQDIVATWVMTGATVEADGLATALFFVPVKDLGDWEFQYVRLLADGSVERSGDFVGELYV